MNTHENIRIAMFYVLANFILFSVIGEEMWLAQSPDLMPCNFYLL